MLVVGSDQSCCGNTRKYVDKLKTLGLVEDSEKVESEPFAKWHEELEQVNNLGRGLYVAHPRSSKEAHGSIILCLRDENRIRDPVEGQLGDKHLRSASENIC